MGRRKLIVIERKMAALKKAQPIADFVKARVQKRGDLTKAITAAEAKFRVDQRTVQRALKTIRSIPLPTPWFALARRQNLSIARELHGFGNRMLAQFEFIRKWIPRSELEALGDLTQEWALQIARERQAAAELKSRDGGPLSQRHQKVTDTK